jgi:tetratricopeptide (TPR) repeat protein
VNPSEWDWRLGRAYCDLADDATDRIAKEEYLAHGLKALEPWVGADPPCGAALLWHGVIMTQQMMLRPLRDRVPYVLRIRDAFTRACAAAPDLALAHHALGEWHWVAVNLGWVERQAVRALFGGPLPTVTHADCLAHFRRSAELDPDVATNCLRLGQCYAAMQQPALAREWLQRAVDCPAPHPMEAKARDKAAALLKSLL